VAGASWGFWSPGTLRTWDRTGNPGVQNSAQVMRVVHPAFTSTSSKQEHVDDLHRWFSMIREMEITAFLFSLVGGNVCLRAAIAGRIA
jgi:hypothetical protein